MINRKISSALNNYLIPAVAAAAVILNLGGKTNLLWVQSAKTIFFSFLILILLLITFFSIIWKKIRHLISTMPRRHSIILAIVSLPPAILLSFAFPNTFPSSILITSITAENSFELLELKSDGHVIPLETIAADYSWQAEGGRIIADAKSRPMLVKLNTRAGATVEMLFRTGPQGGSAEVRHNRQTLSVDTFSETPGETLLAFRANFRGVPNWLFMPVVYSADMIAYFIYFFIIFLLQECGAQALNKKPKEERFLSHRWGLFILIALASFLHILNALSVPLIFGADSPSFIRGAFHLVHEGNFDGVAQIRGPGTTLLFAPVAALFGRNPWGVKILLHLLAISLVPLSYRIGWQLSGRRSIAFLAGLAAVLMPDLYFFSNFLMSDLPNLVIVSTYTTLLISALISGERKWIFGALLTASFGALLRSENLALLALGAFVLFAQPVWEWINGRNRADFWKKFYRRALTAGVALVIALLPVLGWSWRNYKEYSAFGLGNYGGEVFYTGWIYYAEGSGYRFTDPTSPAVQSIQQAIKQNPIERMNEAGVPTGWNLYPSLIKDGYSQEEAFGLMTQAVWDSIRANPRMAREVLIVKLKDGLTPVPTQMKTFPLAGEPAIDETLKAQFFDSEKLRIPGVIELQRGIYQVLEFFYANTYPLFVWLGLAAVYFSLASKPELIWWSVAAIALTRIFIPDIMGKADWRYTLGGMVLIQTLTVVWFGTLIAGVTKAFRQAKA